MEPWHIALLIKPLALLVIFAILYYCVRKPFEKYMPDGKLKRALLTKLNET